MFSKKPRYDMPYEERDRLKRFRNIYLFVLITVFLAGGIARLIQQYAYVEWFNGIVEMFG